MPWKERTVDRLRLEFIELVSEGKLSVSEACRRFGISRTCGHKWLRRFREEGAAGLTERSRRPHTSPVRVSPEVETLLVATRRQYPKWGARKLRRILENQGYNGLPAPSTITGVLIRHGLVEPEESAKHKAFIRFEHERPNDLWQMDFKGHVPCPEGRCHPLVVLDDHSRFNLVLDACLDETLVTVQRSLRQAFERYGLPWRMLMDNGAPWATRHGGLTKLCVWLMRLHVKISHGRPYHPQTQGKLERLNRTVGLELLGDGVGWPHRECQRRFDNWRHEYNWLRPHDALDLDTPGQHYEPSARALPAQWPPIEYADDTIVRKVQDNGAISYNGALYPISKALHGYPVALRPDAGQDGHMKVYFCQQRVALIDVRQQRVLSTFTVRPVCS